MKISEVKKELTEKGLLDQRQLFCYSTLTGVINGQSFQNLVGIVFGESQMTLYGGNMDGSLKEALVTISYDSIQRFDFHQRFLYAYVSFSAGTDTFRFYNYDKKVMKQGFKDAGLLQS